MNRAAPLLPTAPRPARKALRFGFVPLVHAAPLLVAAELGLFRRQGLHVHLSREVGWATIREKILSGELDAAQALAPMPLTLTLGLNSLRVHCLTALVLTVHGNAVVLSRRLWNVTSGEPRQLPEARRGSDDPFTFGIVYPHSAQLFLLRQWCRQAGLLPDRDYRLVVVPPPQMVRHLKAGHLDGFCVGEPWASESVRIGIGVIAALSPDLAPGHPEKVLLVRHDFTQNRAAEHAALVRALLDACAWCAHPDHRAELISLLANRSALGLSPDALRPALTGHFDLGGNRHQHRPDAVVFHGSNVNRPAPERMAWLASELCTSFPPDLLGRVYRPDLYHAAVDIHQPASTPDDSSNLALSHN